MTPAIALIILGLVCLVLGGELLVRGASKLAALAGISPLVIGLTIVAFGTSAPELAVSINACLDGQTDIAVGNVVGSCTFNVLFILGISALISPLVVSSQLVRFDVPLMIIASTLALFLGLDGGISRVEGAGLFTGILAYTFWTIRQSRKESAAVKQEFEQEYGEMQTPSAPRSISIQIVLMLVGLVMLTFGARWLVEGAVTIARLAGMSELLIGLTIVAAGTSLPEVATSVLASIRGERDIAVGNVVGSNLFNILCVLGLSAIVVPDGVAVSDAALQLDIPVMIAVAVACLPIFFTDHLIARWEGGLFFGYYIAYTTYLVLAATLPAVSVTLGAAMTFFVIPLTVITLAIGVFRKLRHRNSTVEPQ
ncbi:MAG: sodium:calcium antiporter [Planctomyces sp.]|nr:sodium:calcium antiporter [Planctomyces sp.]